MTILYIIVAATIALFLIRVWLNKKQNLHLPPKATNETDLETSQQSLTVPVKNRVTLVTSKETPTVQKGSKIDLITSEDRPVISKKNKWLSPTDSGKLERGVVD